ncbi:hypothetical protein ACFL0H_15955 [Thermodesulfobacteriota bacterium]
MSEESEKNRCPDCYHCQMCSENRCRLCRNDDLSEKICELGTGFTYGQYIEWKRKRER